MNESTIDPAAIHRKHFSDMDDATFAQFWAEESDELCRIERAERAEREAAAKATVPSTPEAKVEYVQRFGRQAYQDLMTATDFGRRPADATLHRSKMTTAQAAEYIQAHGQNAYMNLPY